jgi:LytR cell envelope-related transcriptional attenuator
MGRVNTGTARIVIIVALLVTGGLLLANGYAGTSPVAAGSSPQGGTSPSASSPAQPTQTNSQPPAPETPKPAAPKDTPVAVFNGTNFIGLAATVMDNLVTDGYRVGQEPTDAPSKPVEKTVVYFVGGPDAVQNESNATALAHEYFKGAKVRELSADLGDLVDRGVQVVVVVGVNDGPPAG